MFALGLGASVVSFALAATSQAAASAWPQALPPHNKRQPRLRELQLGGVGGGGQNTGTLVCGRMRLEAGRDRPQRMTRGDLRLPATIDKPPGTGGRRLPRRGALNFEHREARPVHRLERQQPLPAIIVATCIFHCAS